MRVCKGPKLICYTFTLAYSKVKFLELNFNSINNSGRIVIFRLGSFTADLIFSGTVILFVSVGIDKVNAW